jgi:glutamate-1-semialdehyde 2,1-aminomutase
VTVSDRYQSSEDWLRRAEHVIPLGSQTFSKSKTQYPKGVSPFFITKGQGSKVWDVDGNEYIDFVGSLCSINLGYGDADVTAAVRAQLDDGTIFTLPHTLETIVAEKIVKMVPCAEMVRFGKNGSDATSGAVRVARAFTGRDRVAVCGYHGWQDWYIGSTPRNFGVPKAVSELTHSFAYNDLASLEKLFKDHPGEFACVILEPMTVTAPAEGFLAGVKQLTHKHGAVLVFDETVTGFRFANGGAQELFGVTPDLATFGKGMANGYPLSAVVGRRDIMKLMEEVFFSFTFGGETLSLAAAAATLDKLERLPVLKTVHARGSTVLSGVKELVGRHQLDEVFSTAGHPAWSFLLVKDTPRYSQWEIKTLLLQELFARGILAIGTHNMSYAHSEADVERLLQVYDEVFTVIRKAVVDNAALDKYLRCEPLVPLFRVR